ncbi:MAG: hypothetical protein BIFFINMI_00055 [Phycisphaerae bacterium]|nr:hypothetical protein [Phycisphaerae bacterium]
MSQADPLTYLTDVVRVLKTHWPDNRVVNIVCHGHSVPAGYFATPLVDTFNAYPHLLHASLKSRFPFAALNVIVSAIGGENSAAGASRFDDDVLGHRPDVATIDYGLNDRRLGLAKARDAWRSMIERCLARSVRVILLTPTPDTSALADPPADDWRKLLEHAAQIRELAAQFGLAMVDSLAMFQQRLDAGAALSDLLSWSNHPNRAGHEIVAAGLLRWFPAG